VAWTARVQRAKRLIDDTDPPMTEIALSSGFRSLRRFNGVFAEVYKRSPIEIRRVHCTIAKSRATDTGLRIGS
jgi:AraC family transcriptional regulator of adaptative response / DNA-3-methyladenine glycosylase II